MQTYTFIEQLNDHQIDDLMSLYRGEFWCKHRQKEDVCRMLSHTDIMIGVLDEQQHLVGFCRLITDFVYKAVLFDLIIHPAHRGQQLGRQLMDRVIGHPRLAKVEHIDLNCLAEMMDFYEKWQFRRDQDGLEFLRRYHQTST